MSNPALEEAKERIARYQAAQHQPAETNGKTEESAPAPQEQAAPIEPTQQTEQQAQAGGDANVPTQQGLETQATQQQASEIPELPDAATLQGMTPDQLLAELQRQHQANRVLQGKHRAEVPRLARENRQLREQLSSVEGRMQEIEAKMQSAAPPPGPEDYGLTDEEREYIPEELLGGVRKILERERTQDREAIEQLRRENADIKFQQSLVERVPQWRQINGHAAFHQWLAQSGQGESLQAAFDRRDAETVAEGFEQFLSEASLQGPASGAVQTPQPTQQRAQAPQSGPPPTPSGRPRADMPESGQQAPMLRPGELRESAAEVAKLASSDPGALDQWRRDVDARLGR